MNILSSLIGRQTTPANDLHAGAMHLQKGKTLHVPGASGWRVKALNGSVWITQDGEFDDVVLEAGESYVFDKDGAGLLTTFSETDLCVAARA